MISKKWITVLLVMLFISAVAYPKSNKPHLFPKIKPFKTDYLKVSDIHELYYELCGNPNGLPVVFLHGGPGGGISEFHRRFYNPKKYLIVLFDQRGAGKSKPFAEIKENNTTALVEDIEKLRNHLNLGKVIIAGGSWGVTLGIAYAEKYPQNVSAMILRGVFLGSEEERKWFYSFDGTGRFFPDVFEEFAEAITPGSKKLIDYNVLMKKLQSKDEETVRKFSNLWAFYEIKAAKLEVSNEQINQWIKEEDMRAFATMETYYAANLYFLKPDQLWENLYKIKNIPVTIVQGRYDTIIPPAIAYKLHKLLPKSKLVIAESSGHSMSEPNISRALLEASKSYEDL